MDKKKKVLAMARNIFLLWNRVPVMTVDFLAAGLIDKDFNQNLTDAAVTAFDEYLAVHYPRATASPQPYAISKEDHGPMRRKRPRRFFTDSWHEIHKNPSTISSSLQKHDKTATRGDGTAWASTTSKSTSLSLTSLNDRFFEHQRDRGYHLASEYLRESAPLTLLREKLLPGAATAYLVEGDHGQFNANRAAAVARSLRDGILRLDTWAAVQRSPGACHEEHVHEDATVSGVYYARVPNPAETPLVFRRPDNDGETTTRRTTTTTTSAEEWVLEPVEGRAVLFPPWLPHSVPPSKASSLSSSEPRVSFAFNVSGLSGWGDPWDVTRDSVR